MKATKTFSEWQERAALPVRTPLWLGGSPSLWCVTRTNLAKLLWHFHQVAPASARDFRNALQLTKLIPEKKVKS